MVKTIDVRSGRLSKEKISENFADMHPPLSPANEVV